MRKPRKLRFCSTGEIWVTKHGDIQIHTPGQIHYLIAAESRKLAKRLEEMAEYVEWKREKKR